MKNQNKKSPDISLPDSVFYADWQRKNEQIAASQLGISLFALMGRAGKAAFQLARRYYPASRHWLILCGNGNNGGDGYMVATLAAAAGLEVTLIACSKSRSLTPEAEQAKQQWLALEGKVNSADMLWPKKIDLIIDGLLGIGLHSAPREPMQRLITLANTHIAPKISLDIPSGLEADTGTTPGVVIHATHTLTFMTLKPGLLTGQARDYVGQLHQDQLGLTKWLKAQKPQIQRLNADCLPRWFKPRRPCSHKGEYGCLLLVGGDYGLGGAIRMAAEAALRSGAGLVRVLTKREHITPLLTARPELMVQTLNNTSLNAGIQWADVLVVGPGLGQSAWSKQALQLLQTSNKPGLWDADALNLLALNPETRQNRVITPHPGEAARLLSCSITEIESNRLLAARNLVARYGGVVVLKGAGTLIASSKGEMAIADVGNPGMATGGMGDILAGIIGSLMAQNLPLYDAACAGCIVHGAAADRLAKKQGMRGLLATDLLPMIPTFVNPELMK